MKTWRSAVLVKGLGRGSDPSWLKVWDMVLTCPWRAPTGPAAGWGPPSGPGTLWSAAPAGPPSASTSSLRSPSRSPPSSEEQQQSMLGVCLHFLITQCTVCVCVLPGCCPSDRTLREGFQTPADESCGFIKTVSDLFVSEGSQCNNQWIIWSNQSVHCDRQKRFICFQTRKELSVNSQINWSADCFSSDWVKGAVWHHQMTSAWTIRSNPAPLQWTHTPQMMSGVCYSQVCVPPSTGLRLCDLEDKRASSGLFLTLLSSLAVCVNVTEQWGGGGVKPFHWIWLFCENNQRQLIKIHFVFFLKAVKVEDVSLLNWLINL